MSYSPYTGILLVSEQYDDPRILFWETARYYPVFPAGDIETQAVKLATKAVQNPGDTGRVRVFLVTGYGEAKATSETTTTVAFKAFKDE